MSKSIRIRTTPDGNDKYVKVNLEQDFDFLEILSLRLTQEEVYSRFCSDYGVIVGRVTTNDGFGVPNAKVSIFIPISEEDKDNALISGIYPFENVNDKDSNGIRYNLLPDNKQHTCHTPIGTFPSKRKILDNDVLLEVYDKYYKFTTVTNQSGDYMIFGVSIGNHTMHMDIDLSDVGFISTKPYELISRGYNKKLFKSNTTFKDSKNLDSLSQVISRNMGVDVKPFWGDIERCEVGITRVDFDLNYEIIPNALFFGSIFGDDDKNSVNKNCRPQKDVGEICNMTTSEGDIEILRRVTDDTSETEILLIDGGRLIDENGNWAVQIPMNLERKITDEFGNLIDSPDPDKGIPTKTKVRFKVSLDENGGNSRIRSRGKFLVPNMFNRYEFDDSTNDADFYEMKWKKIYTVRQHIGRFQLNSNDENKNFIGIKKVDECGSHNPFPFNRVDTNLNPLFNILCILITIFSSIVSILNGVLSVINSIIWFIGKIGCFGKHINSSKRRGACRCALCAKSSYGQSIETIADAEDAADNLYPNDPENKCAKEYLRGSVFDSSTGDDICDTNTNPCYDGSSCYGCDDDCKKKCKTCRGGKYIPLECNGVKYYPGAPSYVQVSGSAKTDRKDWLDCQRTQLAETLNAVTYEFYNDWINGSLYAYLFKYKVKYKKNDKILEKFCDYDCGDPTGPHQSNTCSNNFIVEKDQFTGLSFQTNSISYDKGVVKEFNNELFYPALTTYSTSNNTKHNLLYATNITEVGSSTLCDVDNVPFIINDLLSTTYKKPDNPDDILFNVSCGGVNITNQSFFINNIVKSGEIGIDFLDNGPGLNPFDVINQDLRDYFCDNFTTWGGGALPNTTLNCSNDLINSSSPNQNPYYFYFGIKPGRTALDKLKITFFDNCIS